MQMAVELELSTAFMGNTHGNGWGFHTKQPTGLGRRKACNFACNLDDPERQGAAGGGRFGHKKGDCDGRNGSWGHVATARSRGLKPGW